MCLLEFVAASEAGGSQETCRMKELTRTSPPNLRVSWHHSWWPNLFQTGRIRRTIGRTRCKNENVGPLFKKARILEWRRPRLGPFGVWGPLWLHRSSSSRPCWWGRKWWGHSDSHELAEIGYKMSALFYSLPIMIIKKLQPSTFLEFFSIRS